MIMKHRVSKFVTILLFITAFALPASTSIYAEAPQESKEMNCCEKMYMMEKEMKKMMDHHKMMKNDMKNLFMELQQSGKLTQEQKKKMMNIEQMMDQMEEKMKQMSAMETEELK